MDIKIKRFPGGTVSPDGSSITVDAVLENGKARKLIMQFEQLDWLTQALLTLGNGAYQRQISTGKLLASNPVEAAMLAESFRVLPNTSRNHAIVQITGRVEPNAPIAMGSFCIDEAGLRDLSARLLDVAEQLRQSQKLS